ncbi:MAG: hypothetical protein A2541_01085 [Candidatus Taylorbacteria bacterium RIFOXYD2_FULL_36_9]|uniref:Uncharacterized protein n=1 Tax=Candidatus Taylorbacteria bacterium RIFOXYD2_FULL_36_9 TaxID=1802338 RepID=A0A1G2PFB5_9BACT|nr:MAG: hypothetical protein A2541_01085 [Candidatus Taylorbacteria bacterium RIFOXYD2_FULL_36_9]
MSWELKVLIATIFSLVVVVIWILLKKKPKQQEVSDETETTSPHKEGEKGKKTSGLGWIVGLIVVALIGWGVWYFVSHNKKAGGPLTNSSGIPVTQSAQYEWYWKLPSGVYMHGRNESAPNERTAEAIPRSDGSIWADLHYMEYGSPETQRIRLWKVSDKMWEGDCDQDRPQEHCRLNLIEVALGVYAGKITWKDGSRDLAEGNCYLKRK